MLIRVINAAQSQSFGNIATSADCCTVPLNVPFQTLHVILTTIYGGDGEQKNGTNVPGVAKRVTEFYGTPKMQERSCRTVNIYQT